MNSTAKTNEGPQVKNELFYGWIIVAAVTLIYAISEIPVFAFGIFVKPMETELGWSREVITRAFGLFMLILGVFSVLGGILVDRIGPKLLNATGGILMGLGLILCSRTNSVALFYLGYSVLGGTGLSFIFVPNQATIARWFVKKKGLALGIMFAGGGIGTLIATPLLQNGIDIYGWRTVYFYLGLSIICIPAAAAPLLKKNPGEIGLEPLGQGEEKAYGSAIDNTDQSKDFTLRQALKSSSFWILNIGITLMFMGFFMAQVSMVPHLTDNGIPAVAAALALGIASAFNALGRVLMGAISDTIGTKRAFYISMIVGAIMLFWLSYVRTSYMMYLFVIFFGLANGGSVPQIARMVSELFGVKAMGGILGVSMLITTLGPALGPVLGGASYVHYHSYSPAFLAGGGAILCALLLIFLIKVPAKGGQASNSTE